MPCETMENGAATRGFRGAIENFVLFTETFIAEVDRHDALRDKIESIYKQPYFHAIVMINEHIRRAVIYQNERLKAELIDIL